MRQPLTQIYRPIKSERLNLSLGTNKISSHATKREKNDDTPLLRKVSNFVNVRLSLSLSLSAPATVAVAAPNPLCKTIFFPPNKHFRDPDSREKPNEKK